jgi:hypothetical protein
MKRLNKGDIINVGDLIYVPASGYKLEVTKDKIEVGKYTQVTTANCMLSEGVEIYKLNDLSK